MELDIVNFDSLIHQKHVLCQALFNTGIVGVRGVPDYTEACQSYIGTARQFAALHMDASISYHAWEQASYERYQAIV